MSKARDNRRRKARATKRLAAWRRRDRARSYWRAWADWLLDKPGEVFALTWQRATEGE